MRLIMKSQLALASALGICALTCVSAAHALGGTYPITGVNRPTGGGTQAIFYTGPGPGTGNNSGASYTLTEPSNGASGGYTGVNIPSRIGGTFNLVGALSSVKSGYSTKNATPADGGYCFVVQDSTNGHYCSSTGISSNPYGGPSTTFDFPYAWTILAAPGFGFNNFPFLTTGASISKFAICFWGTTNCHVINQCASAVRGAPGISVAGTPNNHPYTTYALGGLSPQLSPAIDTKFNFEP
jgi:hypothetical protein